MEICHSGLIEIGIRVGAEIALPATGPEQEDIVDPNPFVVAAQCVQRPSVFDFDPDPDTDTDSDFDSAAAAIMLNTVALGYAQQYLQQGLK